MDSYAIIESFIGIVVLLIIISEFSPFHLIAPGKFGLIVRIIQVSAVIGFFWSLFNFSFTWLAISVLLLIITLTMEVKWYDKEKNTIPKE